MIGGEADTGDAFFFQPHSPLPLRVDFDMEMDVVVDEVLAEEAEELAGAVVAPTFDRLS